MAKCIMLGVDVHDETLVVKMAVGTEQPETHRCANSLRGRGQFWKALKAIVKKQGCDRVVMAYEASCQGFGLYDEAREEGLECHVLAPTKIARSVQHLRRKTDEEDAQRLFEVVRGHVLAGNELPTVAVPDLMTREDREVTRARQDVSEKLTLLKTQVQTLLKRNGLCRPKATGKGWTKFFEAWLQGQAGDSSDLQDGAHIALATLLRQKEAVEKEIELLDREVARLSRKKRYAGPVEALTAVSGVGVLTAMLLLTELGDLSRFASRKQIGAYLGLVPSSNESGKRGDRKGHITHQGLWRVRRALCQCTWTRVRTDPEAKAAYARIVARNPKHKKIAVVAMMRRLAVLLWHIGLDAQRRNDCFEREAV